VSGLTGALGLLTRIPVAPATGAADLSRAVPWFPVVGLVVGALVAGVYALAGLVLTPFTAAVLAAIAGALVTGAFHEDGLADVADAFAGGRSRAQRLEILDDPRLGTFGVLALASSFLLRVGALAALDAGAAFAVVPAAHALSRVGGILPMRRLPPPAPGGLGASYAASLSRARELRAVLAGLAIGVALVGPWAFAGFAVCCVAALGLGALARAKIGGIGGDVLGATQQLAELSILLLGVALVRAGFDVTAWWWR
jgi:adenosylcobinamide-GDP ribazoletransferase